jgi:PHO85 cyclin-6/7
VEPALDIHTYNSQDLLRLLASLLTQIATTNDALPSSHALNGHARSFPPTKPGEQPPIWHTLATASRNSLGTPTSSMAFHARNIPTISLEAYLLRILKYCPTTNEVFLSLLVYFDRMSKLVGEATGRTFVIDSYNVHRLVIAGVTVASKFFSDVFYTNSRYAKVSCLFVDSHVTLPGPEYLSLPFNSLLTRGPLSFSFRHRSAAFRKLNSISSSCNSCS